MRWWRTLSRRSDPEAQDVERRRRRRIVRAFAAACESDDAARIASLLTPDAELVVDGGGAFPPPVAGCEGGPAASDLIRRIRERHPRVTVEEHPVNGAAGILLRDGGTLVGVISVETRGETISHIWAVLNPDKLVRFDVA